VAVEIWARVAGATLVVAPPGAGCSPADAVYFFQVAWGPTPTPCRAFLSLSLALARSASGPKIPDRPPGAGAPRSARRATRFLSGHHPVPLRPPPGSSPAATRFLHGCYPVGPRPPPGSFLPATRFPSGAHPVRSCPTPGFYTGYTRFLPSCSRHRGWILLSGRDLTGLFSVCGFRKKAKVMSVAAVQTRRGVWLTR
jgi:hypothetical protein